MFYTTPARVLLLLLLLPLAVACDSSDEDPPEEDGINGVWLRSDAGLDDPLAFYLEVTPARLTAYYYLQTGLDCTKGVTTYGLVSASEAVSTYEGDGTTISLALDSDNLVATTGSEVTQFERAALDLGARAECSELLAPFLGAWGTDPSSSAFRLFNNDAEPFAQYWTSYNSEFDCYESNEGTEVVGLRPVDVSGTSMTLRDVDSAAELIVTRSGIELIGPSGETMQKLPSALPVCMF